MCAPLTLADDWNMTLLHNSFCFRHRSLHVVFHAAISNM